MRSPRLRIRPVALVATALCGLLAASVAAALPPPPGSSIVASKRKISNLSGDPGLSLGAGDLFGSGVARIGDVDGDGVPDVVVGARGTTGLLPEDTGEGAVWVLLMNSNGSVKSSHKISAALPALAGLLHADDNFGRSVAGIGDVDGDGVPDIAVGAPNDDAHDANNDQIDDGDGINRGAIYIIRLDALAGVKGVHKTSDLDPGLTIPNNSDQFGRSIAALGDLGGDGPGHFALAVGASGDRDADGGSGFLRGAVYVLFMHFAGGGFPIDHVQKISDTQGTPASLQLHNADAFGSSVAAIGDLDGNGTTDLAVGAPLDDDNNDGDGSIGANRGAVYVMRLAGTGEVTAFQKISELAGGFSGSLDASDFLGDGVESLPDLDGNGVRELVVGTSGDDDGASGAGAAYVLLMDYDSGSHAISVARTMKISTTAGGLGGGLAVDDAFGSSVTNVGDLDGDGLPDLLVGAPGTDDGAGAAGAAYLVRLGRSVTTLAFSPFPAHCGDALTLTATVTPSSATGTVELFEGAASLGTATLAGGSASFGLAPRPVGTYPMTAKYYGDDATLNSASAPFSLVVSLAPTTVSVTSSGSPTTVGSKVELTAHVTPATATGTVSFFDGLATMGSATVSAGTATISTTALSVGSHSITAVYAGDDCHAASEHSPAFVQVVDLIPTRTTLISDMNPAKFGTKVTLTATVSPLDVTGSIQFFDGTTPLGVGSVSYGEATLSVSTLDVGKHSLTAEYGGDATHGASTSREYSQEIIPDNPPTVHVLFPNGGENLPVGGITKFTWEATDDNQVASVTLCLSRDLGATYEVLAADIPNTGTYTWMVTPPGTNGSSGKPVMAALFKVKAKDNSGQGGEDQSDAPFSLFDVVTAVIVTRLDTQPVDQGVAVRWSFADPSMLASITLQRADNEIGPWTDVATEPTQDGETVTAVDRTALPGRTYWYRLLATTRTGAPATFGPVKGEAAAIRAFALSSVAPNPTRGPFSADFAVARESHVSLSLLDLQGRVVTTLVDATYPPGRYRAQWDGVGEAGRLPAGMYVLRYQAAGAAFTRRVVIVR